MFRTALLTATILAPTAWANVNVPAGGYVSPNATSDQAAYCPPPTGKGQTYPAEFTWGPGTVKTPRSATAADGLTPYIEQHRMVNGTDTIVATWKSFSSNSGCQEIFRNAAAPPYTPAQLQQMSNTGCGPFGNTSHVDLFRLWLPGDTFLVYPAVYTGTNNNIVEQAQPDYYTGSTVPTYDPDNVTIMGVPQNGIRPILLRADGGAGDYATDQSPVYLLGGIGGGIYNLDVELPSSGAGIVQTAVIYDNGGGVDNYDSNGNAVSQPTFGNFTLEAMRVEGGEYSKCSGVLGANGIFSTPQAGGTLNIVGDELAFNGSSGTCGSSGPGHNAYLAASSVDASFNVYVQNTWSHDAFYGHLFKSRSQKMQMVGNYFQGGLPQGGNYPQAEAYDVDYPNGGALFMENNILTKNQSGANSNGVLLTVGEEGTTDSRPQTSIVEHSTFGAFSAEYDDQNAGHYLVPMQFSLGGQSVSNTIEFGFCPTGNGLAADLGSYFAEEGFADMQHNFIPSNYPTAGDNIVLGSYDYQHVTQIGRTRIHKYVGAEN